MALDLSVLKDIFLELPKLASTTKEITISSQYRKHVDRLVQKLDTILKLLMTPEAPLEGLVSNYFLLVGDKSADNFMKFLQLKGINTNKQSKLIDLFKIHLKQHDNLIESSPILSKLSLDGIHTSTTSLTPVLTSLPKIKSPISDGGNSPRFENILKKDNIEKGLKELAFNSEAGVNKFNENFQKFNRFFNRSKDHKPNDS
jgi:hypothetical protein